MRRPLSVRRYRCITDCGRAGEADHHPEPPRHPDELRLDHLPESRPKLGDRFWFHNNTYKWNGKRGALFGHTDGTIVILAANIAELSAVAYYPGGTLAALGQINFNSPLSRLAIVGGTGIYATARGEVSVRSLGGPNSNKSAITVRLWM